MNAPFRKPRRQVQFSKLEDLKDVEVRETDAQVLAREVRARLSGGWDDDGQYSVVEGVLHMGDT